MPGTRKLGRPTDQRMAMLRQQVTDLLDTGRMETTVSRAKEIAPVAEKMITLGKAKDLASYRQAPSRSLHGRTLPRRSLTRLHRSMPTATAATPASPVSASAAAMRPRWQSSNSSETEESPDRIRRPGLFR